MKKILIMCAIAALATTTSVYAASTSTTTEKANTQKAESPCQCRQKGFKGPKCNEEFAKRLNLTEAQKEKIKKNHEADRAKMEPIMQKLIEKEKARFEIIKKYEASDPELQKLNKEIKALKEQRHKLMEQNKKAFESILTKEQKAELEKMKAERKNNRPKRPGHHGMPPRPEFK